MSLILVVDDEPAIRESLAFALGREGFGVAQVGTLAEAARLAPDAHLVLLDLVLPDGSGLDFLRRLRADSDAPVIVLTSRDDETDRVLGLELGADDYVVKPFSPREVVARVRAVLRRVQPAESTETEALSGPLGLNVDARKRRAAVGDKELHLSRTEFDLLHVLLQAPGKVFERPELLLLVWGNDVVVGDRTVDVHVKALRKKLEEAAQAGALIETVRGVGYRLRES
ncbi:MAG: response regulator transcription factor [Deltaproteobacteria bacterium]|nr:response regulator transcription factor [Deltaproteobacteria bacterium]